MRKYAISLVASFILIEILCIIKIYYAMFFPIKYENLINVNAQKYNLEPYVIASVINVESSFKKDAKSNAGAVGLMQILPSTASYVSSIYNINYSNSSDLFSPEINIEVGCAYLRYLLNKFNNLETTIASYNAGETVVRSWLNNEEYSINKKSLINIPYTETKNYINKINKNIKIYKKYKI